MGELFNLHRICVKTQWSSPLKVSCFLMDFIVLLKFLFHTARRRMTAKCSSVQMVCRLMTLTLKQWYHPLMTPPVSPTGLSLMIRWGRWWHWSLFVYPDPVKHMSALCNPLLPSSPPAPLCCFPTCTGAFPPLPIDWSPFTRLPSSHFTRVCTSQRASA